MIRGGRPLACQGRFQSRTDTPAESHIAKEATRGTANSMRGGPSGHTGPRRLGAHGKSKYIEMRSAEVPVVGRSLPGKKFRIVEERKGPQEAHHAIRAQGSYLNSGLPSDRKTKQRHNAAPRQKIVLSAIARRARRKCCPSGHDPRRLTAMEEKRKEVA